MKLGDYFIVKLLDSVIGNGDVDYFNLNNMMLIVDIVNDKNEVVVKVIYDILIKIYIFVFIDYVNDK